jgi:hypothetical protein
MMVKNKISIFALSMGMIFGAMSCASAMDLQENLVEVKSIQIKLQSPGSNLVYIPSKSHMSFTDFKTDIYAQASLKYPEILKGSKIRALIFFGKALNETNFSEEVKKFQSSTFIDLISQPDDNTKKVLSKIEIEIEIENNDKEIQRLLERNAFLKKQFDK